MTKLIIEIYRAGIGLIFIIGMALGVISVFTGSYGIGLGLSILAGTVALTGVSALLLSINDHLAAIRTKAD